MNEMQVILAGVKGAVAAMDAIGFIDTSRWSKGGKLALGEIVMDTVIPVGIFYVAFVGLRALANRDRS